MRTFIAISWFWVWLRSFWLWATMPVGRWVRRTAESVLLTCWPPAPCERNVSTRISSQSSSISTSSSTSGSTSTSANVVWRRFCESNGLMRTSRCTPRSARSQPYARRPSTCDRGALDAGLLAFQLVEDLGREAMPLRPAQVHAQEHLGPVGRLGAAGAGADRQDRVAVVVLAGEQERGPLAAEVAVELGRVAVQLGLELGVGALGEQLDGGQQVAGAAGDGGPRLDLLAETAGLAE